MTRPQDTTVYALKAWTIRRRGETFFIAPTYEPNGAHHRGKGYRSLQAACAAVARKLAEEWLERDQRRNGIRHKERAR